MMAGRIACAVLLCCICAASIDAQDATPSPAPAPVLNPVLRKRPPNPAGGAAADLEAVETPVIALVVPTGTPVQVALDDEVRVSKAGQSIQGHVIEPVYAFDKLVIPVGTVATGHIKSIEDVSSGKRTMAALDADFTPAHKVEMEFNELVLPDGKHIPVETSVTAGTGQALNFITAKEQEHKKGVSDIASEKAKDAREQAKHDWDVAIEQVKQPGKLHRLKHAAIAQLPAHPQYIDAGTVYFAELQSPLNFGSEPLTPQLASALASPPPPDHSSGSVLEGLRRPGRVRPSFESQWTAPFRFSRFSSPEWPRAEGGRHPARRPGRKTGRRQTRRRGRSRGQHAQDQVSLDGGLGRAGCGRA
jgi:hypothetical protein